MSFDDISVRVSGLSKCYQIYETPRDRLKQFILPRMQRLANAPIKQYFGEFWALRDVSFEVCRGQTVGIIGRNGSGKSTLLQMICGTLSPTIGEVETKGRIAALLELGSGFNPEFTGRDNVYMNGAVLGLSREEIDERFDDIAAFADIGRFIEQPVKTYSSGMAVRLAFAVQATIDPDIFVVDEALAVGDEKFQRKCFARLEDLKSRGTSILFVSHAASSIVELCDKTLLLEKGRRLMFGPAPKAVRAYQRLIYAPVDEQAAMIKSYRDADHAGVDVDDAISTQARTEELPATSSLFDPGLVPETTMVYPSQGAEISSISIRDGNGLHVNILEPRQDYEFVLSGRFKEEVSAAYFGLHIRSISGTVVTGQRHPEDGAFAGPFKAAQEFNMRFKFKMDAFPGTYFVGGGIWSNSEPNCLHRIMDAIMFRVSAVDKQRSFGYADMSAGQPQLEVI